MTESYSTGDVVVKSLVIHSPNGNVDLTTSFTSFSLYESIFTPGFVLDVEVLDTTDFMGKVKLSGMERISLVVSIPGGEFQTMEFYVDKLKDVQSLGAQKSKIYVLNCYSIEAFFMRNEVIKAYTSVLCSDIVKDIHKNFVKSSKELIVEDTISPIGPIQIPKLHAFEALNLVKHYSFSSLNKSSIYSYFETRQNGKQQFRYVTIESLFRQNPVKAFKQYDAINVDFKQRQDDNILSYQVPQQFSAINKASIRDIGLGISTTGIGRYDFTVRNPGDSQYATGGSAATNLSSAMLALNNQLNPLTYAINLDYVHKATNLIPEMVENRIAYMSLLKQNVMKIRVPGDFVLTSGSMINCIILDKMGLTTNPKPDPLLSGNFLISRIHHRVGMKQERPRYTCIIECLKGKYEGGV